MGQSLNPIKRPRRIFLLVALVVVGILAMWATITCVRANHSLIQIRKNGGQIVIERSLPGWIYWPPYLTFIPWCDDIPQAKIVMDGQNVDTSNLPYLASAQEVTVIVDNITHPTWEALSRLNGLQSLWVHSSTSGWEPLCRFDTICCLYIDDPQFGDPQCQYLPHSSQLTELMLSGTSIGNDGLKVVGQIGSLEAVFISHTMITDEGMEYLVKLPNLEYLGLIGTSLTDDSVAAIKRMETLERVNLTGTDISDDAIEVLRDALPSCTVVKWREP